MKIRLEFPAHQGAFEKKRQGHRGSLNETLPLVVASTRRFLYFAGRSCRPLLTRLRTRRSIVLPWSGCVSERRRWGDGENWLSYNVLRPYGAKLRNAERE